MRSISKAIQADVVGTLLACDWFDDITVLPADSGDLATIITNVLAAVAVKDGKTGVFVIVEEPIGNSITTIPAPYFDSVKQKITVGENRVVNRSGATGTGKSAYLIAETILQVLFDSDFAGTTNGPIWPGTPAINPVVVTKEYQELDVMLELHAGLPQLSKVSTPTITDATGSITLACGTSGAAIMYSIDGSFPSLPYSIPFSTPATGELVRAIAKKSTMAASNIAGYYVP